jgi:hypothetical protein
LEKQIQQAKKKDEFLIQERMMEQTKIMHEEYLKLLAEHKMEKMKENLTEFWSNFRKQTPQFPEYSTIEEQEKYLESVQESWEVLEE